MDIEGSANQLRETGREVLSTVLKVEKNINVIERVIYNNCVEDIEEERKEERKEEREERDDERHDEKEDLRAPRDEDKDEKKLEQLYFRVLYQTVGDIACKVSLHIILSRLKDGEYAWGHPAYDAIADKVEEHLNYLQHPFELVEGVATCGRCRGERVYTYSKQTAGGDEALTVFYTCARCRNKWTSHN